MSLNKKNSFVRFLDDYAKQTSNLDEFDYSLILSMAQYHYLKNAMYENRFVGMGNTPSAMVNNMPLLKTSPPSTTTNQYCLDMSYNMYHSPSMNAAAQPPPTKALYPYYEDMSYNTHYSYSLWNRTPFGDMQQQQYSHHPQQQQQQQQQKSIWVVEDYHPPTYIHNTLSQQQEVVKEYIHIDVSMQSIQDILSIIEKYPLELPATTSSPEMHPSQPIQYARGVSTPQIVKEYNIDLKSMHNIKEELQQLNEMVGMQSLKQSVLEQLIYFIQELHVGNNTSEFKHTAIFGSPGTGKTDIAKIIGSMYSKLGILKNNVFKKVTRNDLIAGYLGQTALKTRKIINECLGGVLFIDEAYSLGCADGNDTYSKECIDTLCEALSDNKDNLMVIVAGYEDEMNETFFKMNKGLSSRFIWRFTMDPYTPNELMQIFKKKVIDQEWMFSDETEIKEKWFHDKKDHFPNYGRDMELLLTYTKIAHGTRIYGKPKELKKKITLEDMNRGYETLLKNRKTKKNPDFMNTIYV
jgi:chromosomal replication initiation ATPase DnaA